jgi:nicotinate-nucleotide--dimethylbenzimidazole phosphoribosyltransferase
VRWWLAADSPADPAHELALTKLGLRPVLHLGMALADATAGLLAVPVLRAAVRPARMRRDG